MRLLYLILVLILLAVPLATASVNLIDPTESNYNLGDDIVLSGSVSYAEPFQGHMTLLADCNNPVNLDTVVLNLGPNEEYRFVKAYTLTEELEGTCDIQVIVTELGGDIIEEESYNTIVVSSQISLSLTTKLTRYQLGDTISLTGLVTKQKGFPIGSGLATLFFMKDGEVVFLDSVTISSGQFTYSKELVLLPGGEYTIRVRIQDKYSNTNIIEDALSLEINNEIAVTYTTNKQEYLPGEDISIIGSLRGEITSLLQGVQVKLLIDDEEVESTNLQSSQDSFSFDYTLANNVKSGEHILTIKARDLYGNQKIESTTVYVTAVPTSLSIETTGVEGLLPEEKIEFTATLLDQADDPIKGIGIAYLYNTKDKLIDSKNISLADESKFTVPQHGIPGTWTIKVEAKELEAEQPFGVKVLEKLTASLEGEVVSLTNDGNIKYNGEVIVYAKSDTNEYNITAPLGMAIEETSTINLARFFPSGTYDIDIPAVPKTFENVKVIYNPSAFDTLRGITGSAIYGVRALGNGTVGILFLILVVGLLGVFIVRQRMKGRYKQHGWEKEYQIGENRKREIIQAKGITFKRSPEQEKYRRHLARKAYEDPKPTKIPQKGPGEIINLRKEDKGPGSAFGMMFG